MKEKIWIGMLTCIFVIIMPIVNGAIYYFTVPDQNYFLPVVESNRVNSNVLVFHETGAVFRDSAGNKIQVDPDGAATVTVIDLSTGTNPTSKEQTTDIVTASAIKWFQDPNSRTSAHAIVSRGGDIFIATDRTGTPLYQSGARAYHAGASGNDYFGLEVARMESEINQPLSPAQKRGVDGALSIFQTKGVTKYTSHDRILQTRDDKHIDGEVVLAYVSGGSIPPPVQGSVPNLGIYGAQAGDESSEQQAPSSEIRTSELIIVRPNRVTEQEYRFNFAKNAWEKRDRGVWVETQPGSSSLEARLASYRQEHAFENGVNQIVVYTRQENGIWPWSSSMEVGGEVYAGSKLDNLNSEEVVSKIDIISKKPSTPPERPAPPLVPPAEETGESDAPTSREESVGELRQMSLEVEKKATQFEPKDPIGDYHQAKDVFARINKRIASLQQEAAGVSQLERNIINIDIEQLQSIRESVSGALIVLQSELPIIALPPGVTRVNTIDGDVLQINVEEANGQRRAEVQDSTGTVIARPKITPDSTIGGVIDSLDTEIVAGGVDTARDTMAAGAQDAAAASSTQESAQVSFAYRAKGDRNPFTEDNAIFTWKDGGGWLVTIPGKVTDVSLSSLNSLWFVNKEILDKAGELAGQDKYYIKVGSLNRLNAQSGVNPNDIVYVVGDSQGKLRIADENGNPTGPIYVTDPDMIGDIIYAANMAERLKTELTNAQIISAKSVPVQAPAASPPPAALLTPQQADEAKSYNRRADNVQYQVQFRQYLEKQGVQNIDAVLADPRQIAAYQQRLGVAADGKIGPNTGTAARKALASSAAQPSSQPPPTVPAQPVATSGSAVSVDDLKAVLLFGGGYSETEAEQEAKYLLGITPEPPARKPLPAGEPSVPPPAAAAPQLEPSSEDQQKAAMVGILSSALDNVPIELISNGETGSYRYTPAGQPPIFIRYQAAPTGISDRGEFIVTGGGDALNGKRFDSTGAEKRFSGYSGTGLDILDTLRPANIYKQEDNTFYLRDEKGSFKGTLVVNSDQNGQFATQYRPDGTIDRLQRTLPTGKTLDYQAATQTMQIGDRGDFPILRGQLVPWVDSNGKLNDNVFDLKSGGKTNFRLTITDVDNFMVEEQFVAVDGVSVSTRASTYSAGTGGEFIRRREWKIENEERQPSKHETVQVIRRQGFGQLVDVEFTTMKYEYDKGKPQRVEFFDARDPSQYQDVSNNQILNRVMFFHTDGETYEAFISTETNEILYSRNIPPSVKQQAEHLFFRNRLVTGRTPLGQVKQRLDGFVQAAQAGEAISTTIGTFNKDWRRLTEAWRSTVDELFSGWASIDGATSLMCNVWTDQSPVSVGLGRRDLPSAYIAGERYQNQIINDDGTASTEYIYKYSFMVDPKDIVLLNLPDSDKFVEFHLALEDANKRRVEIVLDEEDASNNRPRLRLNGLPLQKTSAVPDSRPFERICIVFDNPDSLEGRFKRFLEGDLTDDSRLLCNSLIKQDTEFDTALPFFEFNIPEASGEQQRDAGERRPPTQRSIGRLQP